MTDKKLTDEEIIRNYEWCIGCTTIEVIGNMHDNPELLRSDTE